MNRNTAECLYLDGHLVPAEPTDWQYNNCTMVKSTARVPSLVVRKTKPFDIIHMDLSGKFLIPSLSSSKYYILFLDDATRYT